MAGGADVRAGKAFVEFYVKHANFTKGINAIQGQIRNLGAGLGSIGKGMMAAGAGILAPLMAAAKSWASNADDMGTMAAATGLTVEALTSLKYAANQTSVSTEALAKAFPKLAKFLQNAAEGGKEQTETLAQLGLRMADLKGMSLDDQFRAFAGAIGQIENPTTRVAMAMKVFGKSGAELLPMISEGSARLGELEQEARDLGMVMSGETVAAGTRLNKRFELLWMVTKDLARQIGSSLAPYLQILTDRLKTILPAVRAWIDEHKGVVAGIAAGAAAFAAAGAGLFILGKAIGIISVALTPLKLLVTALPAVFSVLMTIIGGLLSPMGLVVAAVGVLAYVFRNDLAEAGSAAFGYLKNLGTAFAGDFKETWGGIADAIAAGDLALAAEVAWAGLKTVWARGVNELGLIWEKIKWWGVSIWDGMVKAGAIAVIEITAFCEKAWARIKALQVSAKNAAMAALNPSKLAYDLLVGTGKDAENKDVADAEARRAAARRALDEDSGRKQQAHDTAYDENLADRQAALDAASKALTDARGRAKTARTAAEAAKPGGPKAPGAPAPMEMPAEAAAKMTTAGTFSGYALSLMGTGSGSLDRVAAATEDSRAILKRIEDLLGKGMKTDVQFA